MKKTKLQILGILLMGTALVGCEADYNNKTRAYELPPELSHCKIYNLYAEGTARNLTVLHCPRRDNTY